MTKLMILCALIIGTTAPVHAMTEQSSVSSVPTQQSQYADPDDAEEQFSDGPSNAGGPSGREQSLLGDQDSGSYRTYGLSEGYTGQGGRGYFGSTGGFTSGGFR